MRSALVTALTGCVEYPLKARTKRFLRGLSFDELQFIAEYLGAKILESGCGDCGSAVCPRHRSEDDELKMIVLLEYLGVAGRDTRCAAVGRQRRFLFSSNPWRPRLS